jgi:hypothetical protein
MGFRIRLPRSPSEQAHGLHSQLLLKARKYIEVLKRALSSFDMTLEGARVDLRHIHVFECAHPARAGTRLQRSAHEVSHPAMLPILCFPSNPMGYRGHGPCYERRDTDSGDMGAESRW